MISYHNNAYFFDCGDIDFDQKVYSDLIIRSNSLDQVFASEMIVKLIAVGIFVAFLRLKETESCNEDLTNINIVCDELKDFLDASGTVYRCFKAGGVNLVSVPNSDVVRILHGNGSQVTATAKAKIEALTLQMMRINFIPKGIKTNLPKLKYLFFFKTELRSVSQKDMYQFGNTLEYINLSGNLLTSLDGDVFESNKNLKYILLNLNPIQYIDPLFFDSLKKINGLSNVNLMKTDCMSQSFTNSTNNSIFTFKWNNEECFTDKFGKTETFLQELMARNEHSLNNESCLKKKFDDSTRQFSNNFNSLKSSSQQIINENSDNYNKLNEKISQIENMAKKSSCKLNSIDQKLIKMENSSRNK